MEKEFKNLQLHYEFFLKPSKISTKGNETSPSQENLQPQSQPLREEKEIPFENGDFFFFEPLYINLFLNFY